MPGNTNGTSEASGETSGAASGDTQAATGMVHDGVQAIIDATLPHLNHITSVVQNLSTNHEITDSRLRQRTKPIPKDIVFSGKRHEDGKAFIRKVERFGAYNAFTDNDLCSLLPLLLEERSILGFEELPG